MDECGLWNQVECHLLARPCLIQILSATKIIGYDRERPKRPSPHGSRVHPFAALIRGRLDAPFRPHAAFSVSASYHILVLAKLFRFALSKWMGARIPFACVEINSTHLIKCPITSFAFTSRLYTWSRLRIEWAGTHCFGLTVWSKLNTTACISLTSG